MCITIYRGSTTVLKVFALFAIIDTREILSGSGWNDLIYYKLHKSFMLGIANCRRNKDYRWRFNTESVKKYLFKLIYAWFVTKLIAET